MSEIKFDNEVWKDINNFEGIYQISNKGNVRSLERYVYCKSKNKPNLIKECILKQRLDKYGYFIVNLKKNQKSHIRKTHRLVAEAFIENIQNLETVNHINGIKTDNRVENLEWLSFGDNARHRTKNLLVKPKLKKCEIIDIIQNCKPAKNQVNKELSISSYAIKYSVDKRTISDILKGKKLYIGENND